jgi:hypothetical protein
MNEPVVDFLADFKEEKNGSIFWNNTTAIIFLGLLGFFISIHLLTAKPGNISEYREIIIEDKKAILDTICSRKIIRLNSLLTQKKTDSSEPGKLLVTKIQSAIASLKTQRLAITDGNADTSLALFTNNVLIDRDKLKVEIDKLGNTSDSFNIDAKYNDSQFLENSDDSISQSIVVTFKLAKPEKITTQVARNPNVGFWIIFSIGQFTFWFMIPALLVGLIGVLKKTISNEFSKIYSIKNWVISSIIPLVFLAIFAVVFYYYLIDDLVIKDQYFLQSFRSKMKMYGSFGYLAAAACFGTFLLTTVSLSKANSIKLKRINNLQTRLRQTEAPQKSADTTQPAMTPTPAPAVVPTQEDLDLLRQTFDSSFFICALILSISVLWLGLLFNTVNGSEIMRIYTVYSGGKPFLQYDLVYMAAAMHTLILLVFYIPVKLKFNSVKAADEAINQTPKSGKKILSNIIEGITTLITTTSPLIASLIQKFLSNLTE